MTSKIVAVITLPLLATITLVRVIGGDCPFYEKEPEEVDL
jgi:hypothetical protein